MDRIKGSLRLGDFKDVEFKQLLSHPRDHQLRKWEVLPPSIDCDNNGIMTIRVEVTTDELPDETSWEVRNILSKEAVM